jgi:succinyl-CoA synthetase beta subunit
LRCAPLLTGYRGRPGTDPASLAAVIAAVVSCVTTDGTITGVEVNPLLVTASGAWAVDALVTTDPPGIPTVPTAAGHPTPLAPEELS